MYHQQHQQQRSEWSSRSQQVAWPGHHPYHAQGGHHTQGGPAPHVHRPPPPPPVHYPPHHQHRHVHAGRLHHQPPYYHGNNRSPAGPSLTRQMPQRPMRAPALVSPSTQVAAVASPRTPQPVTSSPHEADGRTSNHGTPVASNTSAAATSSPLAAANNAVTTKPPRPYTEYTMFYQLEREFILHRILTTDEEKAQNPNVANNKPALFQNDPLMPARYRSLPLRADWYISGKSKKPTKRKHRKSHGKIGFLELTRMIAARWAKVDDETRKYCKMMAAMELVKYKEDMESYNQYKERLSAIGEIPEDMKERILKKKRAAEKKEASKRSKVEGVLSSPGAKKSPGAAIKADIVSSIAPMRTPIKLEPIAHDSPMQQESSTNLDNVMEQFISSLVQSPGKPTAKVITPDRSPKKRRLFREKPAAVARAMSNSTLAGAEEILAPLKGTGTEDDDHLDGIKMMFSGIDESEIAREFPDQVHRCVPPSTAASVMPPAATTTAIKPEAPSFDYWDALVESPGM